MTYAFTSDIGETSCSDFHPDLRSTHPMVYVGGRHRLVEDLSRVLQEGVPYPDHHWNWLPVCTEFDARTGGR